MDVESYELQQLLFEGLENKSKKVAVWVSGTEGLDPSTFVYTLECEIIISEDVKNALEEEINKTGRHTVLKKPIEKFEKADDLIKATLENDENGELLREYLRIHSPHDSRLAEGICPTLDSTDYFLLATKWRSNGYSTEGTWPGGIERHDEYNKNCVYCAARFKKQIAIGSPEVYGEQLSQDRKRKILSRENSRLGYCCGDPVRPKFKTKDVGLKDPGQLVRGEQGSKLWLHRQDKILTKRIQYRYQAQVLEAIKTRLGISEKSILYNLVYGPTAPNSIWPINFKYYIKDSEWVYANLGRVPDLQSIKIKYGNPLIKKWGDSPEYLDLRGAETFYKYNAIVEIHLDPLSKQDNIDHKEYSKILYALESSKDPSSVLERLVKEGKFISLIPFMDLVIKKLIKNFKNREVSGLWVDSKGQAFTVSRLKTGIEGLDFLVNPFMPQKAISEVDKIIPAYSQAWYWGGRSSKHLLDDISELFGEYELTLAPFHQYADYPIGHDGSIYIIEENSMVLLNNGSYVVGEVVEDSLERHGDLSEKSPDEYYSILADEKKDGYYKIRLFKIKEKEEKEWEEIDRSVIDNKNLNVPPSTRRIVQRIVTVKKSDVVGSPETVRFDDYDYLSIISDYTSDDRLTQKDEERTAKEELLRLIPNKEEIDKLQDALGLKFIDKFGIIDSNQKGKEYEWNDPRIWSRNLVERLSTPREIVDKNGKWFLKVDKNKYKLGENGQIYPWSVIEDPKNSGHPYVYIDNQYVSVWKDPQFIKLLELRGDYYNPISSQWERRYPFRTTSEYGTEEIQWVKYNDVAYWNNVIDFNIKSEMPSPQRLTAQKKNILDSYDKSTAPFGSVEWFKRNINRIKDRSIFKSPIPNMRIPGEGLNPPILAWRKQTVKPPGWNLKNEQGKVWPCRQCRGTGKINNKPCPRCSDKDFLNHGNIKLDLWSGVEWISYVKAINEHLKSIGLEDKKYNKLWRSMFFELFKQHDLNLILDQVKYQAQKPVNINYERIKVRLKPLQTTQLILSAQNVEVNNIKIALSDKSIKKYNKLEILKNRNLILKFKQPSTIETIEFDYRPLDNNRVKQFLTYGKTPDGKLIPLVKFTDNFSKFTDDDKIFISSNYGIDLPDFGPINTPEQKERYNKWISAMLAVNTELYQEVVPKEVTELLLNKLPSGRLRRDTLFIREIPNAEFDEYMAKLAEKTDETIKAQIINNIRKSKEEIQHVKEETQRVKEIANLEKEQREEGLPLEDEETDIEIDTEDKWEEKEEDENIESCDKESEEGDAEIDDEDENDDEEERGDLFNDIRKQNRDEDDDSPLDDGYSIEMPADDEESEEKDKGTKRPEYDEYDIDIDIDTEDEPQ